MTGNLEIVILGLSITSSWGNGHAVTYRGLVRELVDRGHRVRFLERDRPWYAQNRDLPRPPWGSTALYADLHELQREHGDAIERADVVIVGSYVHQGDEVGRFVQRRARGLRVFYDIDTPVTLAKLEAGRCEYLDPDLVAGYDLYLSFTGGPILHHLEDRYGAPRARTLYCSADPTVYYPVAALVRWDLGYLGTYSIDRQPRVASLLDAPAREMPQGRFVVAGPQYPDDLQWSPNVQRLEHVAPSEHSSFYASQAYTLNITRDDMVGWGYSPSIRLFEAAACGIPIISDTWKGIETVFEPGKEVLLVRTTEDVLAALAEIPERQRQAIGTAARERVLGQHTAAHRVRELERHLHDALAGRARAGTSSDRGGVSPSSSPACETLQSPGTSPSPHGEVLSRLGPWFHNLHLPDGTETAPDHPLGDFPRFKWEQLAPSLPSDLGGKTVLDIGCNSGFYSFAMAERGAEVLGVDTDPRYLEQARWAQQFLDPHGRTRFRELSVYDLHRLDAQFDIVLFMGVFYHLRHPLLGLDRAVAQTRTWLVFQSLTLRGAAQGVVPRAVAFDEIERLDADDWPKMAFVEDRLAGDPTNWWIPNLACVEAMLRTSGVYVVDRPAHEVFVCRALGKQSEQSKELES